ncbi:fasciclin domain-containing protein [Maribacter algarum]|uniref:Fasciclin domain-containing protein n=1 Tax=Maribacter algarum (ex Zhang et al. 2020) TaxID=2578118 RepID=A0A5S3PQK7_9FLAO|nr:fasciclin domain-containing protein [Maribacter algarum]TMM55945.1 fasciclin domain-containing protein [Maribacter algarum]
MKKFLGVKSFLILIIVGLVITSCNIDDGTDTIPIPETDIVEIAAANADLSSLVAALQRADLDNTLKGAGPFTVLAPTNTAFSSFLSANGFANLEAVPAEVLEQILLNHVVTGRVDSAPLINLQRNYLQTLADGPNGSKLSLYFDAVNGVEFNGLSSVIETDVVAENGIIHIVDQVIAPPTIDTFISSDENFEVFATALDAAAVASDLPENLKEGAGGPYTVFVPSEQAFDNLLATNGDWDFVSDIEENLLAAVLEHHVLNGNIRSTDIVAGNMVATLEGDQITISSRDGNLEITDGSGNEGTPIEIVDIQAANGVIHVISNNVLLPDTTN